MGKKMTDEELAQIQKWQTSAEGKADLAIHAIGMSIADLEDAACTREGFKLIRTERQRLIAARDILEKLIGHTAPSYVFKEAAE